MSYNVDFQHAGDPETLRAIEKANVDIAFLQEVNSAWERTLRSTLSTTYPYQVYRGDDGYAAGLAVLSRWPLESVDELPRIDWFPAVRVTVTTPIGRLQALQVHLRPPRSLNGSYVVGYFSTPSVRESEIRSYASRLDSATPTVVVGDFNEEDGGRAIRWLEERGFQNALPQFEPSADTWHWPIAFFTLGARYDHIFYDDELQVLHAEVRRVGRSDHFPVVGVLAPSPRSTRATDYCQGAD